MIAQILAVLAVFVIQTFLPASMRYLSGGPGVAKRLLVSLGPRDHQPPQTQIGERAQRALANMQEALPVFLAIALLNVFRDAHSVTAIQGARIFLIARIAYVPAYLLGIVGVRSAVWGISWVGLAMMISALF